MQAIGTNRVKISQPEPQVVKIRIRSGIRMEWNRKEWNEIGIELELEYALSSFQSNSSLGYVLAIGAAVHGQRAWQRQV